MPDRPMFSRWDPLNPTNFIAALLLGWAFSVYHRPHLPEILPSYGRFDDLLPWATWGWVAVVLALALLFTPRFGCWRLLAHGLTALYWLGVASAFTSGVGLTSGGTTYGLLALWSMVLFARTAVYWSAGRPWWSRLVARPPRWLRWLARVGEFADCKGGEDARD